ncbi:MAG: threonine--tRNA ligase [Candidatus Saccharibacteria bacterium]|nr:threonine--tRNA ligase [Candidatus Saccharibacteria bacterium]
MKISSSIHQHLAYLSLQALWRLWPQVKFGLTKITAQGLTCDVDIGKGNISEKDFDRIEREIQRLISPQHPQLEKITTSKALTFLKEDQQIYLQDFFKDYDGEVLYLYKQNDFQIVVDLKEVPKSFIENKDQIFFKIIKVGGVYWRDQADKDQLQRLQIVVFGSAEELQVYLEEQISQFALDHRQLGKDQNLFMFSNLIGAGLPLFLENGAIIRREIENFIIDEEIRRGYIHVYTSDIARLDLYQISGHYPYYQDNMYTPINIDDKKFMLRPMTCPHHFQIYKQKPRSYRELPIRLAELAKLYRREKSGELSGLLRVRTFTLSDAHIFCRVDQVEAEVEQALQLIEYAAQVFGLIKDKNYSYRLSLGDRMDQNQKYFKDDQAWNLAEEKLRQVLQNRGEQFVEAQNEAAFYGPKIDIQMRNQAGKEETAFTVQYDFVMPKRFELHYIDDQQETQEVVVIHRSSIGAIERLMGFLIEFYEGSWPVWLAPCQIKLITVNHSKKIVDYAHDLKRLALNQRIRLRLDESSQSVGKKIRQAQIENTPYIVVLGEAEIDSQAFEVQVRKDLRQSEFKSDATYNWSEILQNIQADIENKN